MSSKKGSSGDTRLYSIWGEDWVGEGGVSASGEGEREQAASEGSASRVEGNGVG